MDETLTKAMKAHGIDVERTTTNTIATTTRAATPDLVLLTNNATEDNNTKTLAQLATTPTTQVIPIALLADDATLDARVRAFRHGVVAMIPRNTSADEIARRVAALARELPKQTNEANDELSEATLDELVALVKRELKTNILSVQTPPNQTDHNAYHLMLNTGKPIAKTIKKFVAQLHPLVNKTKPLQ